MSESFVQKSIRSAIAASPNMHADNASQQTITPRYLLEIEGLDIPHQVHSEFKSPDIQNPALLLSAFEVKFTKPFPARVAGSVGPLATVAASAFHVVLNSGAHGPILFNALHTNQWLKKTSIHKIALINPDQYTVVQTFELQQVRISGLVRDTEIGISATLRYCAIQVSMYPLSRETEGVGQVKKEGVVSFGWDYSKNAAQGAST